MAAEQSQIEPLNKAVDHIRGAEDAVTILEYGDYECPFSRRAYRAIQRLESSHRIRFAFRHFPLTEIHPHALAAARAAEAAAVQGRFWEMHDLLYQRQRALGNDDLRGYATELGLDLERFDADRESEHVLARIERDVQSGIDLGEVRGTPTLFIDGYLYDGPYDVENLARSLTDDHS